MVIDFATINNNDKPVLILKNLDGTAIQTLGYAFNIKAELLYNEVSTLEFDIPKYVENMETPNYSEIAGMRIVDLLGYGQFLLIDPVEEHKDGSVIKSCKAYSLEYEFSKKNITLEEGMYNFWNPLSPDDTIMGRIIEKMPGWSVGSIDTSLIGKYRTFETTEEKIYKFIKSEIQETYGCIFDFDTYKRQINVVSVDAEANTAPIYLSKERLLKKINVEEDSDNIVTCLDVNGEEGVSIRSANPTGTNKIYNLDYFLNTTNLSQTIIDKWRAWEAACDSNRELYYNITIEGNMLTAKLTTEQAYLTTLRNELTALQNLQATIMQGVAQGVKTQAELTQAKRNVTQKEYDVVAQEDIVKAVEQAIEANNTRLVNINTALSMTEYFTSEELESLQKYFIEDSIEDSSFSMASAETYYNDDMSNSIETGYISVRESIVTRTSNDSAKTIFSIDGGRINIGADATSVFTAEIVKSTVEFNTDKTFVFTAYLGSGSISTGEFTSGTISATGKYVTYTTTENIMMFNMSDAVLYFTKNTSEYERHTIEQELYEYGLSVLNEKSMPSYSFKIDSGNFLLIDDFISFKNSLQFGKRVYLKLDENEDILKPYVIAVTIDFENPDSFELEFSSTYTTSDRSFKLSQLLEQSVSMGRTLNLKGGAYSEFVNSGANTRLKSFIDSALDVARNKVLSSGNQAIEFGDAGIRIRKWTDDTKTAYDDEQIWIVDNVIAFTQDNWETASMAIGKIVDENLISTTNPEGTAYGIVAPYLVGTLLAGQNLIIDTENGAFRVDSSGVYIDSLQFYITHGGSEYDTTLEDELQDINNTANQIAEDLDEAIRELSADIEGTITTYYQSTAPDYAKEGDLWFDTEYGKLYRYDGDFWDEITDADIIRAIDAAQNAQATADGKIVSYYQDTVPQNPSYGDLWYNSATEVTTVRRTIEVGDDLSGKTLYFNTSASVTVSEEELVIDTESGNYYIGTYRTSSYSTDWYLIYQAGTGYSTIYSATYNTWRRSTISLPSGFGSVAYVNKASGFYNLITADFANEYTPQKLYRYDGTSWVLVEDGSIGDLRSGIDKIDRTLSEIITEDGYVSSNKLAGIIDSQRTRMQSAAGNVLFDSQGIWLLNNTTKSTSTQAIWMNERGILFGTGSATSDPADNESGWNWTTAIGHDGITADALAGKYLSACSIYGAYINIGDGNFTVDRNGNLTANRGTFKGTVQGATFKDSSGNSMTSGGKFTSGYLDLKGMTITNSNGDTTFAVDNNGNVTILGSITLGSGSVISYDDLTDTPDLFSGDYNDLDNQPDLFSGSYWDLYNRPSYITSTKITSTSIEAPTVRGGSIIGGTFYAVNSTSATTGVERIVINKDGITSYDASNRLHGIVCHPSNEVEYDDGFSFYTRGSEMIKIARYLNDITTQYYGLVNGTRTYFGEIRASASNAKMRFLGSWDFSSATVTGLTATFG